MTTKPTDTLTTEFTDAAGSKVIIASLNAMVADLSGGVPRAAEKDFAVLEAAGGHRKEWVDRTLKSVRGTTVTTSSGLSATKPRM